MTERGQIQLWLFYTPPSGKHVPNSEVIENKERASGQMEVRKMVEQFLFKNTVFRAIYEDQLRAAKQINVLLQDIWFSHITNQLL